MKVGRLLLLVGALSLVLVAGCGDDGDSSATQQSAGIEARAGINDGAAKSEAAKQANQTGKSGDGTNKAASEGSSQGNTGEEDSSMGEEGSSGSSGSGGSSRRFETVANPRSFGRSVGTDDRNEITAVVRRYFAAIGNSDGQVACSLLASTVNEALKDSIGSCIEYMDSSSVDPENLRIFRNVTINDARVDGDRGFVFYTLLSQPPSQMPLLRENGKWLLASSTGLPAEGPGFLP